MPPNTKLQELLGIRQSPTLALAKFMDQIRSAVNSMLGDAKIQLESQVSKALDMMREELMYEMERRMKNLPIEKLMTNIQTIKGVMGNPGKDGEDGKDGKDGKDGWTPTKEDLEDLVNEIYDLVMVDIELPENGEDGYTPIAGLDYPTEGQILEIIRKEVSQIKIPDPNLQEIADRVKLKITGGEVVKLINGLSITSENQIDASHIKNLPRSISRIQKAIRGGGDAVLVSDLTASTNGSAKTFTVPLHTKAIALFGTQFPIIYRPTIDWTTSGVTLTLTGAVGAPDTGQTLLFLYVPA